MGNGNSGTTDLLIAPPGEVGSEVGGGVVTRVRVR